MRKLLLLLFVGLIFPPKSIQSQTACTGGSFFDDFNTDTLNSIWTVVDPNPDSYWQLNASGRLELVASPLNGGSDLWPAYNFEGSRALVPVEDNWTVETKLHYAPNSDFEGAGFLLLFDPDATSASMQRINEYSYHPGSRGIRFVENEMSYSADSVNLRLTKEGNLYSTWHSTDGENWISTGTQTFDGMVYYVGLTSIRQPWDGNLSDYSVAAYDYFELTCTEVDCIVSDQDSNEVNLLLYYDFENCVADSVTDLSGNGNTGMINGLANCDTEGPPGLGQGLWMDGDDYVQTPLDANFLPLSISTWFNASVIEGEHSIIDSDIFSQSGHSLILGYVDGDNTLDIQYHNSAYDSPFVVEAGQWYHAVALIDTGRVQLFVNGNLIGERTFVQGDLNGSAFRIGRHNPSDPQWFVGGVDEVRIYNGLLSEGQICQLYSGITPVPEICEDGLDNDGDGLADCDDPDCTCSCFPLSISVTTTDVSCFGGSDGMATAKVLGGTMPYTYLWSDPDQQTTETAGNLDAGVYEVTVTDASGCTIIGEGIVAEPEELTLTLELVSGVRCGRETAIVEASLSGGVEPYTYRWSSGQDQAIAEALGPGDYTLTVTDANGCRDSLGIDIPDDGHSAPEAFFTFAVDGLSGSFSDTSIGEINSREWIFFEGATSGDANPTVTFPTTGTYQVCLTVDNDCGSDTYCEQVEVSMPVATDTVEFIPGQTTGSAGRAAFIPVRVVNFSNVTSFQFSIHIDDPAVARISGASGFALPGLTNSSFLIAEDLIRVVWVDFSVESISVPDSTAIFFLELELSNAVDECTPINIDGMPTGMEVSSLVDNVPVLSPFQMHSGSICIEYAEVAITGRIIKENFTGVGGVTIYGTNAEPVVTSENGRYTLEGLEGGRDYEVVPEKNGDYANGVTALDILLVQQHILDDVPLASPYRIIAADVNGSGTVTTLDLINIRQPLLGYSNDFPGMPSWRFVPADYEFPVPGNPFFNTFPESIFLDNLVSDAGGQDFFGIKLGDVNLSAIGLQQLEERSVGELSFVLEEQSFLPGEQMVVDLYTRDFDRIAAWQLELVFPPDVLELREVIPGEISGLDEHHFGTHALPEGRLPALWYAKADPGKGVSLADGTTFFSLRFRALQPGLLSNVLRLENQGLLPEAYDNNLHLRRLKLEFESESKTVDIQLFPNPTSGYVTLGFRTPQVGRVLIDLYDSYGRKMRNLKEVSAPSSPLICVELDVRDLEAGVYYIIVERARGKTIKKLIKFY